MVTQTVTSGSISTTSVLTSSANPSVYGSSVTFTDTVSASSGTPGGTVTFYNCTTSACRHQDLARDRDAQQLGQGHLSTSTLPVGTTYVEAIYGGLGELRRLDVERGGPGGQHARDDLGPHLVGQPVDLRLLGDLHRHRLGELGHPERAR